MNHMPRVKLDENHAKNSLAEYEKRLNPEEIANLLFWMVFEDVKDAYAQGVKLQEIVEGFQENFGITRQHQAAIVQAYNVLKKLDGK